MKRTFYFFLIISFIINLPQRHLYGQNNIYNQLSSGFKNPPAKANPSVYHWWLGGNVDTVRLKAELNSLKSAGISGFTIFEIGSRDTEYVKQGPPFLGPESLGVIKVAVEEAGKLGMEVGLNTASSWNAGGSWITPEHAAKSIYFSKSSAAGGKTQRIKLPFPNITKKDEWGKTRLIKYGDDGKPVFYKEIAVLAIPSNIGDHRLDTSKVIDVSRFYNAESETLTWNAPAGEWDIYRYVCSNSGENLVLPSKHSAGPIMDHYSAEATEFHFTYMIDKLQSVLGDLRETALKSLYMASYEAKGFTWTTTLPAAFKEINGYSVYKYLPALFNSEAFAPDIHAGFRADFQRTLSELMINNFYKKSKEICNRYGLKNNSEAGGPGLPIHNVPVEPLKALGSLDIPRGEFWINHSRFNDEGVDILRVVKEVSAASNIYDRGIVEMEAFTSFQHWREGPFELKPAGDRAFTEGMNKVVVHGSTHNPAGTGFPGIVYHAGTHYNDKRVWWPKIKPYNEYLSRISYIAQEGKFVADVLYYYGDTIPNYGGHKNSRFTAGPGYDYEIVNTEILKEAIVKNKKIVLPRNNAEFSLLVITDEEKIDPEVLLKLQDMADNGAVIIGQKPEGVVDRRIKPDMPKLASLTDKLWLDLSRKNMPKRGDRIYSNIEPSQVLESLNVAPDFKYPGYEYYDLDYIHYAKNDLDFYFIRNTTDKWISRDCSFRQKNKIPQLWDPLTGEVVTASAYEQKNERINVPVTLAPYGSIFVVFKKGKQVPHITRISSNIHPPLLQHAPEGLYIWEEGAHELRKDDQQKVYSNLINTKTVDGAWEVFFPEGWGVPEKVIFPELISWTKSDIEEIKYFSGTATYKKTFQHHINTNAVENKKIYLDLGDLSHVAEVWLNDQPLGIAWAKPYRFDITKILRPGDNTLVVEVANTWSNRLVGDAITGKEFTRTNIKNSNVYGLNHQRVAWKDVPLLKSGLFGPVKIISLKPISE